MSRFARLLLLVLTLGLTTGLLWLPTVAQAGLTATGID
jgi:hypothetical protein